jgi:PKD repeat protein
MINQKQNIFILMCLYVLANTPVALCNTSSIIYVAGDGTGNYNCDGINDQVQINQALSYAASHPGITVYLKGPFVYDINSSCLIGSNTELTGDSSAKLRLANNVGWTTASTGTPILGQIGGAGSVVHDIKIHGFEINGNEGAQSGSGGVDLYRIISFRGSSTAPVYNISVYNMNLHDAKGEGFRCTFGKNIYYYSNVGNNLQHTCVMYSRVNFGEIHNNVAHQCSCAGDRLDNCQNIIIDNETISPYSGVTTYVKDSKGYAVSDLGVQIANSDSSPSTSNIIIRDCNIMSGVNGVLFDSLNDASNVNCYDNVIHDSGYENEGVSRNGGIGITHCGNGITIQNNDITGSYVAGINVNSAISGTHTVTVSNNNIMNGKTGYAVKNSVASQVSLILTHNYIIGNPANFYPSTLINKNPATSQNSKLETVTALVQPAVPTANAPQNAPQELGTASKKPVSNFWGSPKSGKAPLSVTFTDTSTGSPIGYKWDFGDGTTSTAKSPVHKYGKTGIYAVTLTVSNEAGIGSMTKHNYIKVTALSKKR